jgi:selenocysteine lyase/cysteine desulfurase
MKRRDFFRTAATGTLSLALLKQSRATAVDALAEEFVKNDYHEEAFWKFVRRQFLLPEDYAYFNTGGLGASPTLVLDSVEEKMRQREIKPAPGIDHHEWEIAKTKVAGLFGAEPEEIALTNTTTEGNNIVINGLPLKRGDEIITSTHEHVGLSIPLLNKMERDGVVVKTFEPDMENGLGNVDRIENLITPRTRLIFVSHITCTTGQRMPAKEICDLAKVKRIWTAFDGAQVVGNMPIDVKAYGCDFYTTSGHKWMIGPKRTGALYVRREMLDVCRPVTVGAYSTKANDLTEGKIEMYPTAQRYEYATQNDALYVGLGVAIDFLNQIGMQRVWAHNRHLAEMTVKGLEDIPSVELLSPQQEAYRTSLITFKPKRKLYNNVSSELTQRGFRVRTVSEADLGGVRISHHLYNNQTEVKNLLQMIEKVT